MVTVYINRWGIKIPALLYCYPSKTKGPEYFFLSLSILLFSIIDKAIMQHSDSHHLVEVNLHHCQLLLTMRLLFLDASSIIKSIKEIHAQHVDLPPDNPHVRRYTGRLFSWGNNLQEKIKQFIRFAGKKPVLPDQKPAKK